MAKKTWIKLKCGILEPKHRRNLGMAIYLYVYILDHANWDDGIVYEWVDSSVARELEMPLDTVRDHRRLLETQGYITSKQRQHSQDIIIHNWTNPRAYDGEVLNEGEVQDWVEGCTEGCTEDGNGQGINPAPSYSHINTLTNNHKPLSTRSKKASTPKKQRDELISRFKEKTGLDYPEDVPASTLQKFWWSPASDMISYAGGVDEAWDILRQLIERFDDKGLVFADINSFSKSFNGMIAQKKRGGGVKSFRPTEENDPYFDAVHR